MPQRRGGSWLSTARVTAREVPQSRRGDEKPSRDTPIPDECAGHRDALFVGHHRPAEGHPAAAARATRRLQQLPRPRLPRQAVAIPRGYDLPVAGAAVSLGAASRGWPYHPRRRHRGHHGAVRSGALSPARREVPTDAQPTGPDDVLAHAQTASRRADETTTCRRWRLRFMPRRPARCRSRSR